MAVAVAMVAAILAATLCGLFNGWLVARFRIQPIVATLVLFIAGRGIAQALTNCESACNFDPLGGRIGVQF